MLHVRENVVDDAVLGINRALLHSPCFLVCNKFGDAVHKVVWQSVNDVSPLSSISIAVADQINEPNRPKSISV